MKTTAAYESEMDMPCPHLCYRYRKQCMACRTAIISQAIADARADAVEECAKVADEQSFYPDTNIGTRQDWLRSEIAKKIRALSPAASKEPNGIDQAGKASQDESQGVVRGGQKDPSGR